MPGYVVCIVEIHTPNELYVLSGDFDVNRPFRGTPSDALLSVVVSNRLAVDNPSSDFSITLSHTIDKDGRTWADKVSPQDLVVIQMARFTEAGSNPETGLGEMHTVLIGWVDRVEAGTGVGPNGIPQREVRIHGRDAGKLVSHGMITYWSFLGATLNGLAEIIDISQLNERPEVVARILIEKVFNRFLQLQWQTPSGPVTFWDMLGYQINGFGSLYPGGLDWEFVMAEGSFWSMLQRIANPPFHELFLDTRRIRSLQGYAVSAGIIDPETGEEQPVLSSEFHVKFPNHRGFGQDLSAPVLIMRPLPFPVLNPDKTVETSRWDELPIVEVGEETAIGEPRVMELRRSDHEQFNMYVLFPRGSIIPQTQFLLQVPPVLDRARFHKYGYRPLMPHVNLYQPPSGSSSQDKSWRDWHNTLVWQLAGWYVLNDQFVSAQHVLPLSPQIHVGSRYRDLSTWQTSLHPHAQNRKGMEYYIEGVQHRYIQNQHAETVVTLTRGLPLHQAEHYAAFLEDAASSLEQPKDHDMRSFFQNLIRKGQE